MEGACGWIYRKFLGLWGNVQEADLSPGRKLLLLSLLFISCEEGRRIGITIRNDIQDREYNQIVVDQVKASGMTQVFSRTLKPKEEVVLPFSKVIGFRVSRRYQKITRVYQVSCPAAANGVVIKLIDIHLNRIAGGCSLTGVTER